MSLEQLENIFPPPDIPLELPTPEQWRFVEASIGRLPNDYHRFINKYGTCAIDSFIWIFNPASKNPNLNLANQIERQLGVLKDINESGLEPNIPLFPEPTGVLPFGITDNGDVLLWETNKYSDTWTVSVLPSRSSPLIKFSMDMTNFLAAICEKRIHCQAFPIDFPSAQPRIIQP